MLLTPIALWAVRRHIALLHSGRPKFESQLVNLYHPPFPQPLIKGVKLCSETLRWVILPKK